MHIELPSWYIVRIFNQWQKQIPKQENKMEEVRGPIEDGILTGAEILIKGVPVKFRLAVVRGKDKFHSFRKETVVEYFYAYISEDEELIVDSSFYSGGRTGVGINLRNITAFKTEDDWHVDIEIITYDVDEMNKIAEMLRAEKEEAAAEHDKKMEAKVAELNSRPAYVRTELPDVVFLRGKARYDGSYSKAIKGGDYAIHSNKNRNGTYFNLKDYVSADGKLLTRRFIKDLWRLGLDESDVHDPKETLKNLITKSKELNNGELV